MLLGVLLASPAPAEQAATVKGTKVNVRGKPSLKGEVVTQLDMGETVVVLEEIPVTSPAAGEPGRWARIQLPANTPVYVFAPYIDPLDKTVKVSRLNLRAGPGEGYGVLGRIPRGARVKELRTTNNWMEIEAPSDAFAYVAMDYLELVRTLPTPPPSTTPAPTVTEPPTTVETVPAEPPPLVADDRRVVTPPADTPPLEPTPVELEPVTTPPAVVVQGEPTIPMVETEIAPADVPRRVVIREGRLVYSRSIQAPTTFALESLETKRLINYLHSEQDGLNLKAFAGRKVFVTGEELLDARWARIPLLDVEDIAISP
jgi:hypothetical protein